MRFVSVPTFSIHSLTISPGFFPERDPTAECRLGDAQFRKTLV